MGVTEILGRGVAWYIFKFSKYLSVHPMPYIHTENTAVNKKHITPTPGELILQWEKQDQK